VCEIILENWILKSKGGKGIKWALIFKTVMCYQSVCDGANEGRPFNSE